MDSWGWSRWCLSLKGLTLVCSLPQPNPNPKNIKRKILSLSFKGIRDDLEFLLEEDLSSINLCALHCELRNTEQLLASLGLFSYKVGSLDECNAELSSYGPENFNKRITVKIKEGQETAVEKHNIQVSSFSGTLLLFNFRYSNSFQWHQQLTLIPK